MAVKLYYLLPLLVLVNFIYSGKAFCQYEHEIDSIKAINLDENDKEKLVDNYNTIADYFSYNDVDSAIFYTNLALGLSRQIQYTRGKADSHYQLSFFKDRKGKIAEAIASLEKATEIYSQIGDSSYLVGCYNNLGVFHSYNTNQKKSLEYFIKALNLGEKIDDTYFLAEVYSNIASYYDYVEVYRLALKYYTKALVLENKWENNSENIAICHSYTGILNVELKRFNEAKKHIDKVKELLPEIKDIYRETELHVNFAYYYLEINKTDSAKIFIEKAQQANDSLDYPRLHTEILALWGDWFFEEEQYAECVNYYNRAIDLNKKIESYEYLDELYSQKAKAFSELGYHDRAYEMLQLANKTKQSYGLNEISQILGEFEQMEASKEERNRLEIEQELAQQKSDNKVIKIRARLQFALFLIITLVVVLIIAIYYYILKKKHNEQLKISEEKLTKSNASKDKFFSIIAHDLKNHFNILIGMSKIMLNDLEIEQTDDVEQMADGMYKASTTGYNLLENLLEWARSQTENFQLNPRLFNINDIVNKNISFLQELAKTKKITVKNINSLDNKVYADYNMVNCVVRNLLSNAIKFSNSGGKIIISAKKREDFCIVSVQDFGIGMNEDTLSKLFKIEYNVQNSGTNDETGTGLGLILSKEFVEKNAGEIWARSIKNKGSCFYFSLPIGKS